MTIDWTKPIEFMDGTPVVLAKHGLDYGDCTNPDDDGDYWTVEEGEEEDAINTDCFRFDGTRYPGGKVEVRNRAAPTEQPKTLRDEFAMAALTWIPRPKWGGPLDSVCVASEAYDIADAMMAERERGQ